MFVESFSPMNIFFVFWVICEIFVIWWVNKVRPEKKFYRKYSYWLRFKILLPFIGKRWNQNLDQEDIIKIEKFQSRNNVMFLTLFIPFLVIFSYLAIITFQNYQTFG